MNSSSTAEIPIGTFAATIGGHAIPVGFPLINAEIPYYDESNCNKFCSGGFTLEKRLRLMIESLK